MQNDIREGTDVGGAVRGIGQDDPEIVEAHTRRVMSTEAVVVKKRDDDFVGLVATFRSCLINLPVPVVVQSVAAILLGEVPAAVAPQVIREVGKSVLIVVNAVLARARWV